MASNCRSGAPVKDCRRQPARSVLYWRVSVERSIDMAFDIEALARFFCEYTRRSLRRHLMKRYALLVPSRKTELHNDPRFPFSPNTRSNRADRCQEQCNGGRLWNWCERSHRWIDGSGLSYQSVITYGTEVDIEHHNPIENQAKLSKPNLLNSVGTDSSVHLKRKGDPRDDWI